MSGPLPLLTISPSLAGSGPPDPPGVQTNPLCRERRILLRAEPAPAMIASQPSHLENTCRRSLSDPSTRANPAVPISKTSVYGCELHWPKVIKARAEAMEREANNIPSERAVIVADREGVIREWNGVAESIFGYSAAEVIGHTIDLLMPEAERGDHWRNYRRVMATNIMNYTPDHILDIEGVRKDGVRIHLDAMLTASRDPSGRILGITAVMREIAAAGDLR